jgi:hypothetical protein
MFKQYLLRVVKQCPDVASISPAVYSSQGESEIRVVNWEILLSLNVPGIPIHTEFREFGEKWVGTHRESTDCTPIAAVLAGFQRGSGVGQGEKEISAQGPDFRGFGTGRGK